MNSPESSTSRYKKRKVGDEDESSKKSSMESENVGNYHNKDSGKHYHSRDDDGSSHREGGTEMHGATEEGSFMNKTSDYQNYRDEGSSTADYEGGPSRRSRDSPPRSPAESQRETIVFLSKIPQPPRNDDPHANPYDDLIALLREISTIENETPQCQIPAKTRTLPYMYAFLNYETHEAALKAVKLLDNAMLEELGCREPLLAKLTADRRKQPYSKDRHSDSRRNYSRRDREPSTERDFYRNRDVIRSERDNNYDKSRSHYDEPPRELPVDPDVRRYSDRSRSPYDSGRNPDIRRDPGVNRRSRSPPPRGALPRSPPNREYGRMKDSETRKAPHSPGSRRFMDVDRRDYPLHEPRERISHVGDPYDEGRRDYDAHSRGYDKKRPYEHHERDLERRRPANGPRDGHGDLGPRPKRYSEGPRPGGEYEGRIDHYSSRDYDRRVLDEGPAAIRGGRAIHDVRYSHGEPDSYSARRSEYHRSDYMSRDAERWEDAEFDKNRHMDMSIDERSRRDFDHRKDDDRKKYQTSPYHEKERIPYDDYRDPKVGGRDDYSRKDVSRDPQYRQGEFTSSRKVDSEPYGRTPQYGRVLSPRQHEFRKHGPDQYGAKSREYGYRDGPSEQREMREGYDGPRGDIGKRDAYHDGGKRLVASNNFDGRRDSYKSESYQDRGRSR